MRRSLPIERTTTSPELTPTRICTSTPCARRSSSRLALPQRAEEGVEGMITRRAFLKTKGAAGPGAFIAARAPQGERPLRARARAVGAKCDREGLRDEL